MDPRLDQALQLRRAGRPQEAEPLYRALLAVRSGQAGALRVRRYDFLNFPYCSFIGAK